MISKFAFEADAAPFGFITSVKEDARRLAGFQDASAWGRNFEFLLFFFYFLSGFFYIFKLYAEAQTEKFLF